MKKLLFLLLLISSAAFGQRRYLGIPPSSSTPSSYTALVATDIPSNFLRSNATQTLAGDLIINGGGFNASFGTTGNRVEVLEFYGNTSIEFNSSGVMNASSAGQLNFQGGADILFGTSANQNFALFNQNHTFDIAPGGFEFDDKTFSISGNTSIGSSTHTVALGTSGNTSVTLPTSGTLASQSYVSGYAQPLDANLTTLSTPGTAGYKVQVNALGTDYEFAPQAADPGTTVADMLYLGSISPNAYARLGIGSNGQVMTVSGGLPSWQNPTALSDGDKGDITVSSSGSVWTIDNTAVTDAKISNRTALSVFGRSANTSGVGADIAAGADFNILRRSGTSIGFGSIDLSQSGAVGSSILPVANGGTGSSSVLWRALTGTSTMTGNVTDAFGTNTFTATSTAVNNAYTFNSAFTTTASLQKQFRFNGTITHRGTNNDIAYGVELGNGFTTGASNQTSVLLRLAPSYTANHTGNIIVGLDYDRGLGGPQIASVVEYAAIFRTGSVGIGTATPTARLHLPSGTTSASSSPLKIGSGSLMTTPEAGAVERDNGLYVTNTSVNRTAIGGKIADFTSSVNNVGTGETDLFTYTTKANTLNATGEEIEFSGGGTFNDASATAQIKFYFAGTSIGDSGALTLTGGAGDFEWVVVVKRTGASTASAMVRLTTFSSAVDIGFVNQTDMTSLTFSGTNIIKVTGTAGGGTGGNDDITAKSGKIEWQPAANN